MDSEKLQKAIFGLHTRRFGTTAEIMIKKIINATDSDQLSFDLFEKVDSNRIEVKFSRVQKKAELKITDSNLFKALQCEANRDIMYHEWQDYDWDSNIQQVKKEFFDIQKAEQEFIKTITEKYGDGILDPTTGVFNLNIHFNIINPTENILLI